MFKRTADIPVALFSFDTAIEHVSKDNDFASPEYPLPDHHATERYQRYEKTSSVFPNTMP